MSASLAVADTHALIWYAQGRVNRLGSAARRFFERCDAGQAVVYLPMLVLVELSEAVRTGRVSLDRPFITWVTQLLATGRFFAVDLSWEILRHAEELYAIPERGDRLIAATAVHMRLPLVTRDPEIGDAAGVNVIW